MLGRGKHREAVTEPGKRVGPTTPMATVQESGGLESQEHPLGDGDRSVEKSSAVFVLKRTVREFNDDSATDLAAALTYYSVLALFPGLIALLSLVGLVGQTQNSIDTIMTAIRPLVSQELSDQISKVVASLSTTSGAGIGLVVGILGALLSASGYVGAFSRAMNRILEVEEGRPFWRMRPMQLIVTIISVVLCALALVILIVSGPVTEAIGQAIGVGSDLQTVWDIAKWPVLGLVVVFLVALLYWATPNVRFPKFRILSVGAFVAILVWLVASVGFAFYVGFSGSYNKTYGIAAGFIVALLWIWLTNVALLFGAELDAELERGRQLRRGIAAEETLQLPVRDRSGIDKARKRRQADIEAQREIRLRAAHGGDPADRPFTT